MAVSLHELLQPQVILTVASRIKAGQGRLSKWLGFQPTRYDPATVSLDGPNIVKVDTRYATFRYFDATRTVAPGRAPGTGPATIPVNPIGSVPVSCARWHAKIPLSYEELGNLSPIVGPNSVVDPGGQDYVQRMITHIARRFNNVVELMSSGMMQDNLFLNYQGDNIIPSIGQLTGTNAFGFQVPFQVPAGNKGKLNMLGAGALIGIAWNVAGAPILQQLLAIESAFMQLTGYSLTDIWVNSNTWYYVVTNTELRNVAGSANTPFAEFDRVPEKSMDGTETGDTYAVLRAIPTIRWHITNEVLAINTDIDPSYGTAPATAALIKMVPDGIAFFCTAPSSDWAQMVHCGEYVVENPGMPGALRRGYYFWKEYVTQPSAVDLIGLLNAIPVLYIPKIIAPATVYP